MIAIACLAVVSCNRDNTETGNLNGIKTEIITINNTLLPFEIDSVYRSEDGFTYKFFGSPNTTPEQLTAIQPTIEISINCTITPTTPQDFSSSKSVRYRVMSNSVGEKYRDYDISYIRTKYSDAKLLSLEYRDKSGIIVEQPEVIENSVATLWVVHEATQEQISALEPIYKISAGATIQVSGSHAIGEVVRYAVTAEDGEEEEVYSVVCDRKSPTDAYITNITFDDPHKIISSPLEIDHQAFSGILWLRPDATSTQIDALTPKVEFSVGATIKIEGKYAIDQQVVYKVTSASGETTNEYRITCKKTRYCEASLIKLEFDDIAKIITQKVTIDQTNQRGSFTVKADATTEQIAGLVATATLSEGARLEEISGIHRVGAEVVYTIRSEDEKTVKKYAIECKKELLSKAELLAIEFTNDADNLVIEITIDEAGGYFMVRSEATNEQLALLKPKLTLSEGASVVTSGTIAVGKTVIYTITAEDGVSSKEYGFICRKERSNQAQLLSLTFVDNNGVITEAATVDHIRKLISLKVSHSATDEQVSALKPIYRISEYATISLPNMVANQEIEYKIVSEDGSSQSIYTLYCSRPDAIFYSMDVWRQVEGAYSYQTVGDWASNNTVIGKAKHENITTIAPPIEPSDDSRSGKAVQISTQVMKSKGWIAAEVPGLAIGTLFLGEDRANLLNFDEGMEHGVPFSGRPLTLTGYYKYKIGGAYYDNKENIQSKNGQDRFSITVILFEVQSDKDVLTGEEIHTSNMVVARGFLSSGENAETYQHFSIDIEYRSEGRVYDASKEYKLAIVFTSSYNEVAYNGCEGSQLIIDEVSLVYEK